MPHQSADWFAMTCKRYPCENTLSRPAPSQRQAKRLRAVLVPPVYSTIATGQVKMSDDRDAQVGHGTQVQRVQRPFLLVPPCRICFLRAGFATARKKRGCGDSVPPSSAPGSGGPQSHDCTQIGTMSDDRDDQLGHGTQVHRVGALFSLESKNRFSFRARSKREMVLDLRRSPLAYKPRNRVHPSGLAALGHLPLQGRLGETDCRAGLRTGAQ